MDKAIKQKLKELADKYETTGFLEADPSKFMHLVEGAANQEAAAFIASSLSFGSRSQFLPKIAEILDLAEMNPDRWVRQGMFENHFKPGDHQTFYRFYSRSDMNMFFKTYQNIMHNCGSLGGLIKSDKCLSALDAVKSISQRFDNPPSHSPIPKDHRSACKRICMFLRWMVRDNSPVDIGLWAHLIDKKTLIMPLDTHVIHQSKNLGLLKNSNATMSSALKLTEAMKDVFPDDPVRADFALFGLGVDGG